MELTLAFAAAAAAMLALQAGTQTRDWTPPEELARLGAEAHAACRAHVVVPPPSGERLVEYGSWIAGLTGSAGIPCTQRPDLALRIARAAAASRSSAAGNGHGLLARLYDRGIGVTADPAAARRHRQFEWLLGQHVGHQPFATRAEEEAFLARPATLAFLERYAGVADMHAAHVSLARGLYARGRRADAARVEALLSRPNAQGAPYALMTRVRSALRFGDAEARTRAMRLLRNAARSGPGSGEERALLLSVTRPQLRSRAAAERWEAIESLAAVAHQAEPAPLAELQQAVRAANGGRSPPMLRGRDVEAIRQRLRIPITNDDYPARAIRGELQGRIALRGLIDPRGKLIYTEPLVEGQEPVFLTTTRNIYARRTVPPVDLGHLRTAPYMWIELPGVRYVLPEE